MPINVQLLRDERVGEIVHCTLIALPTIYIPGPAQSKQIRTIKKQRNNMNKLLIVLVFCLAHQSLVEGTFGGLQRGITDKLMALKNLISTAVSKAVDTVDNIVNGVIDTGLQVKGNCVSQIQSSADECEFTIQSMVEDAVKDGRNASHCLRKVTSEGINALQGQLSSCIEKNIEECREYFSNALERIRDFLELSDKFEGEVKNCGVGLLSFGCIGLVSTKIASESGLVGTKIANLVESVVTYGVVVKDRFISCQTIALTATGLETGKYLSEAGLCIDKCVRVNVQVSIH